MAADPVTEACVTYATYLETLEHLIGEPVADGQPGVAHPAHTPEPYGQAGRALMTGHEGIRRLEADLIAAVTGARRPRRGPSPGNTAQALQAIPKLAAGLDDEYVEDAAWKVGGWIADARSCHGIDESRRLRHLPRIDGQGLPPRCPYCLTYQLVADLDARKVMCSNPRCCGDRNGDAAVAAMATGIDGRPQLAWNDGLTEMAPDMDGPGVGD